VRGGGTELKGRWHRRVERRRASNFFLSDQLRGGTRASRGAKKKGIAKNRSISQTHAKGEEERGACEGAPRRG
jgi:hypothetical protein